MRETLRAYLEADATLLALLPGGVFASTEISRLNTPTAFDSDKEIQPCINVKLETRQPIGPHPHAAEQFFAVSFYQRTGFDIIDQALQRVYELLHEQKVGTLTYIIRSTDTVPEAFDPALNCSMALSRFVMIYRQLPN